MGIKSMKMVKLNTVDKIKAATNLREQGYSPNMISKILETKIDERVLERRE